MGRFYEILLASLAVPSAYGRLNGQQSRRRDHLFVPHEHNVTEESTTDKECITGFSLVNSAMNVVADLATGASIRFSDLRTSSMQIVVNAIDEVDWVSCRVDDQVHSEDYERPFIVDLPWMNWLKVVGNSATCECEGFQFTADGNSVSLGNSTVTFSVVQDIFQGIQDIIADFNQPCEPCDEVTGDQVAPSDAPSDVPSDMPTTVPSSTPSVQPSASPSTSPTLTPSSAPTSSPTASPSDVPSAVPSDVPTATPSASPTASPSTSPTASPSTSPSDAPSAAPSDVPSAVPSNVPTATPSASPTASPSVSPTASPSDSPSDVPTATPSDMPSAVPSDVPSASPTASPSASPTASPSDSPSELPTATPSDMPSAVPSVVPTATPSAVPTDSPSVSPSASPSDMPSDTPTSTPSDVPTAVPTSSPSSAPSDSPTSTPSDFPTAVPSPIPSAVPTVTPCIDSVSLVAANTTILQDLVTGDLIDLSTVGASSLSILVVPATSIDSIQFQWEESEILQTNVETEANHVMGGKTGTTYTPVAYLSVPGIKSVVIDVFALDQKSLLCRKILAFTVIEYSGDSAVICKDIQVDSSSSSSSQGRLVIVPPL